MVKSVLDVLKSTKEKVYLKRKSKNPSYGDLKTRQNNRMAYKKGYKSAALSIFAKENDIPISIARLDPGFIKAYKEGKGVYHAKSVYIKRSNCKDLK